MGYNEGLTLGDILSKDLARREEIARIVSCDSACFTLPDGSCVASGQCMHSVSEDVLNQADTMSLYDLEAEIEGSGIDPHTCVDRFVVLNGDKFFVTL